MSEEILIRHCSPTLAGIKTGNIVNFAYGSEEELKEELRRFNRAFAKKGLIAVVLRQGNGKALIYIYRPKKLQKDFMNEEVERLLAEAGYPGKIKKTGSCIAYLSSRLKNSEDFPHEIGLFLGYPPEDVAGFIENARGRCRKCKLTGDWKVYGDRETAEKKFCMYRKCTDIYYNQWMQGKSIERLIVAV